MQHLQHVCGVYRYVLDAHLIVMHTYICTPGVVAISSGITQQPHMLVWKAVV
jgi:hypothetical protein